MLGTRHPDHALVGDYALAIATHGLAVILYANAPYAVIHGWPTWVIGAPPDPDLDVNFYWRATGRDDGLTDPTRAQSSG